MASVFEFLLVFLLSLSLVLVLLTSFNTLSAKIGSIYSFTHSIHTLSNLSLFAGLTSVYSNAVFFPYQQNSTTFIILFNKVKYGNYQLDCIANFSLGGFIVKSPNVPT
ncbi:MAG: hypothetical protein QXV64_00680 [Candidatus Anstonellaceae archaeon]